MDTYGDHEPSSKKTSPPRRMTPDAHPDVFVDTAVGWMDLT
jgi:hypothetical protein